ncbi:MAG: serine/threonine protein kinase, partial [Armatimonadetes bacterium]|nr:serine/threonine protein kinase [Armatimonadota bacterium]
MVVNLQLSPGVQVNSRYRVNRFLGAGGFSSTYLAADELAGRDVVLKELAPPGSARTEDGLLLLPDADGGAAHRLRHQFIGEARLLSRLRIPGVVAVYDAFQWGGTAYMAVEYRPDALPLSEVLEHEGRLPTDRVGRILEGVARSLEAVHQRGYLHRDIKPSNILIGPGDETTLIDFGSAREWQADATVRHTTLFTPGYAPLEQLSESGRRGPATDLYALAATGYEMLVGAPPPSAVDRVGGAALPAISLYRNDVPAGLASAVTKALALRASDRPQSAAEFLSILAAPAAEPGDKAVSELERMDLALESIANLKVGVRECPACEGLLEEPRPLKPGVCPVCRVGRIRDRRLNTMQCAVCGSGVLRRIENLPVLRFCPICRFGPLLRGGIFRKRGAECGSCGAEFKSEGRGKLALVKFGSEGNEMVEPGRAESETDYWFPLGGRSATVFLCETCGAQFDQAPGNRRTLAFWSDDPYGIAAHHRTLTPEEWARTAARLPLDAGNSACESCGADYYVEGDTITLLDADRDPFGFLERHQGRLLRIEQIP